MADSTKVNIEVFGLLNDINFVRAKCCANDIHKQHPKVFNEPVIKGMLEFEWDLYIEAKKKEIRGEAWSFSENAIIFINNQLIGGPNDFIFWAEENYQFQEFRPMPLYETLTEEGYKTTLNSKNHEYVYFDVNIGDEPVGKIVIELFTDVVPKTCSNFKSLCIGDKGTCIETDSKLSYADTLFHRIVPNGWIQGGDVYHSRGNGGESVYGTVFEDENFAVPFSNRGIVGMANKGRHTNASQFFITLQPAPWMNTNYVAFGQIIEGTETLKKIEEQETMNERPVKDVKITDCGVSTYEF
ncbi:hypothetical protein LOTGIDRAFT_195649 [Lottia gigantea]|uniref:Peptidyl-prolyl cis-trans isomerase n=1 Tax=Lottia gigantea TaxID=225164 RepID=V3ZXP1_LOTGI|nr:hypothetical protein LOTGIDRAFT_195649 [Lottia gigantea]ESO85751.1 hypothetical protein LOTGIDRAFT_195649 [Lottia gigantea]